MKTPFEVPRIGLEPTRLSTLAPETSASTISPSGPLRGAKVVNFSIKQILVGFFIIFSSATADLRELSAVSQIL